MTEQHDTTIEDQQETGISACIKMYSIAGALAMTMTAVAGHAFSLLA